MLAIKKINSFSVLLFLSAFLFFSCSSAIRFSKKDESRKSEKNKSDTEITENDLDEYRDSPSLEIIECKASYYAHEFNGRKTSNGEVFDMNAMTAAHIDLPFDTIIRVTNLSNGKKVIIRINDRTPPDTKRPLDLSLGAAKKLDMINDGVVDVKLEILKWGKE